MVKNIRLWTLAAGIFGVYVFYVLFMLIEGEFSWWTVLDTAALIVYVVCLVGLWKQKRWARYLSLYLMAGVLGLGCYLTHFVWTFWIFEEPTLWDRIRHVIHPRISSLVIFPLVWIGFFLNPRNKQQFS